MKRIPKLDAALLRALAEVALALGLDRKALLAHVAIADSIPTSPTPAGQMLVDLHTLNGVRLDDGSVPLRTWLANAIYLGTLRTEKAIFQRALDALGGEPFLPSGTADPRLLRRAIHWQNMRWWGYREAVVEVSLPLEVCYRLLLLAGNSKWRIVTTTERDLGWKGTVTSLRRDPVAYLDALWNSSWGHDITAHLADRAGGGTRVRFKLTQTGHVVGEGEWEREVRVLLDPLNEHLLPAAHEDRG